MPWNGSGAFQRIYNWVQDAANGINITASRMDTDTDDITNQGFGNCLTRDGQGIATANLPMGGFKHTGVANAVAASDYVALGQLQTPGTLSPFFAGLTITANGLTISAGGIAVAGAAAFGAVTASTGAFSGPVGLANNLTVSGSIICGGGASFAGGVSLGSLSIGSAGTTISAPNGNALFGTISATGAIFGFASGWTYDTSGPSVNSSNQNFGVISTGTYVLANGFFASSDERLKFDIKDIDAKEAVEWVTKSQPKRYRKRSTFTSLDKDAVIEAGFIAQDQVRIGVGEFVAPAPCKGMPALNEPDMKLDADHMLTLSPGYQIAFLTAALKDALSRIERLENPHV